MSEWKHIDTAPKDGTEILICLPGGHSDHYFVVYWDSQAEQPYWASRHTERLKLTTREVAWCYLQPMWMELPVPPSSLCAGPGILSDSPFRFDKVTD